VHLEELRRLRDSARETGQFGAAIQAEVKRGGVVGFYVKRRENVTQQFSPGERVERIKQLLASADARLANATVRLIPSDCTTSRG
jgi:hypothetical protein